MTESAEKALALLRAALRGRMDDSRAFASCDEALWCGVYDLASKQGVLALAWDAVGMLPEALRPPRELCLRWAVNVARIEELYRRQEAALARLAAFYRDHGMPMMALKGYGLSRLYPVPEHRPCGDIDIWLFGRQPEADRLVAGELGIPVDSRKEHHTTFRFGDIPVENHYDFVNTQTHASNVGIERLLKHHAEKPGEAIRVNGVPVYLPSVAFNALFLVRHAGVHFAAARIGLRHLTDWYVFVARCHAEIDWPALYAAARQARMTEFLNCLNALCIDFLGLDAGLFPRFAHDAELECRVLNEILTPEFSQTPPSGVPGIVWFKTRRWWANRWKHRMVFDEHLARAFLRSAWAHLKRPQSIIAR